MFRPRIESSIDEASLEGEWSRRRGEADTGDGIALVTDPAALRAVLGEAEERFQNWAERAKNREEFDCVVELVRNIRELLAGRKPVPASLILDLTLRVSYPSNWERLPEPVFERQRTLEHVLYNLVRAIEREKGLMGEDLAPDLLAEAAQVYVANDWMHDRWLAKFLAGVVLSNVRSSVAKSAKRALWWTIGLQIGVAAAAACLASRTVGVLIFMAALLAMAVIVARLDYAGFVLDSIIGEVGGGCFAGGVVAERLERLNGLSLHIPSILVELLRSQRC
jgi:hypothetical protein